MNVSLLDTEARPEAMADVPGPCELELTRAVIQYRDAHELDLPGGRIQDIGLALVLDGRYAASAEAIDLGSARLKTLDLSAELVVLDWVYEPTLKHLHELLRASARAPLREEEAGSEELGPYCFRLALELLERVGFTPLTRSTFLRVGFRDVCRDLDLHEGTSVRIVMDPGRLTRAHLDYEASALVFRTAAHGPDLALEEALEQAFPEAGVCRLVPVHRHDPVSYQVRFAVPLTLFETRRTLRAIRRGLGHLLARFEPARYRSVEGLLRTFGARDTLARVQLRQPRVRSVPLEAYRSVEGPLVH